MDGIERWKEIIDEYKAFHEGKERGEHICEWRANQGLLGLILRHPDAVRLKPLMKEIAEKNRVLIDYTQPFDKIYEKLYFAAKVLERERRVS